MKQTRLNWRLTTALALAGASMAWGCSTVDWEKEMAESRRPDLPGEKTLAAWKESLEAKAWTEESVQAACSKVAREALAASGSAFPEGAQWHTAFLSEVERVEVAGFRDANGRQNRFAVYGQIGNKIPYYWIVEGGDAESVAATAKDVWEVEGILERADVEMAELGTPVLPPYERFRFRFLDDAPEMNWIRPCRYLFEDADGNGFTVLWKRMQPRMRLRSSGREIPWKGESVIAVPSEQEDVHSSQPGAGQEADRL